MKPKMTQIRQRIYEYIVTFKVKHDGNSPTLRHLALHFECSTSVIDYQLGHLEGVGLIERNGDRNESRKIQVVGGEYVPPTATVRG